MQGMGHGQVKTTLSILGPFIHINNRRKIPNDKVICFNPIIKRVKTTPRTLGLFIHINNSKKITNDKVICFNSLIKILGLA